MIAKQTANVEADLKLASNILRSYKSLGGEYSSSVLDLCDKGSWGELGGVPLPDTIRFSRGVREDVRSAIDYLCYNFMRKYPVRGLDRRAKALELFWASEEECRLNNERIYTYNRPSNPARPIFDGLREKIRSVLGTFSWADASVGMGFGPGATTRLSYQERDLYYKFAGKPQTTLYNLPAAVAAVGCIGPVWRDTLPLDWNDAFEVVPGSKITTVPKDSRKDRVIAIEPCMNLYVQRGIGALIKSRLLSARSRSLTTGVWRDAPINLFDQTRNQDLARLAVGRGLCTIDLSSASDSVSFELVKQLLPEDWFEALQRCRSPRFVLEKKVFTFSKYSSMGNGYTFELESLIFWAIAQYVIDETYSADVTCGIYGDDIIVPSFCCDRLIEVLNMCGFKVNMQKSFWSGDFRESCGSHYIAGNCVTPVYVDDSEVDLFTRPMWLANSILDWHYRISAWACEDASLVAEFSRCSRRAWLSAARAVKRWARVAVPVGDGGLRVPPADWGPLAARLHRQRTDAARKGWRTYQRGFTFKQYVRLEEHLLDRSPVDAPWLTRNLKRLEDSRPNLEIYYERGAIFIKEPREYRATGLHVASYEKKSCWSSSWPVNNFAAY